MSQRPCSSFACATYDPSRCRVCSNRFAEHIKSVREAWWRSAPDVMIDLLKLRLKFLDQANPEPCVHWNPICVGEDLRVCLCGRIRNEHNLRVIVRGEAVLKGKRNETAPMSKIIPVAPDKIHPSYGLYVNTSGQCSSYRKLEPGTAVYCRKMLDHVRKGDPIHEHEGPRIRLTWMDSTSVQLGEPFTIRRTASSACEDFSPVTELPGYCKFCGFSYIEHSEKGRGFQLEDMPELHSPGCVSVVKTGLNRCSCLDDSVKQMMLDSLGEVRKRTASRPVTPTECSAFDPPQSQTSDACKCGKRFHEHSLTAKQGFDTWARWRAAHMTDIEVINWFVGLGTDHPSRMREFKHHLDKPDNLSTTAPPPEVIKRISQMLPAEMHALLKVPTPGKRTNCMTCGSALIKGEQAMCEDCQHQAVGPDWAPNTKPRTIQRLATEHNINSEVKFD